MANPVTESLWVRESVDRMRAIRAAVGALEYAWQTIQPTAESMGRLDGALVEIINRAEALRELIEKDRQAGEAEWGFMG